MAAFENANYPCDLTEQFRSIEPKRVKKLIELINLDRINGAPHSVVPFCTKISSDRLSIKNSKNFCPFIDGQYVCWNFNPKSTPRFSCERRIMCSAITLDDTGWWQGLCVWVEDEDVSVFWGIRVVNTLMKKNTFLFERDLNDDTQCYLIPNECSM